MANQVMNSASAMLNEQFNYLVPFLMHFLPFSALEVTNILHTDWYLQEHVVSAVSWSWLINTCLISNFYGDGLNYVSIETDFLSYHMIWLRAQETKENF